MKIAFLITDYSLGRGGERVASTLVSELSAGMEVHLLSLYQAYERPFFTTNPRVHIHVLTKLTDGNSTPRNSFISRKICEIKSLTQHLRENRYDVIIGVASYSSTLLGLIKPFSKSKAVMAAWEHSNFDALSFSWKAVRTMAYSTLDAIICLNKEDERLFASQFKSKKVYTIPNLISFSSEEKSSLTHQRIISIGAFEHEKGFDLLLKSFKKLNDAISTWELVLIGAGSQKGLILQTIEKYNLPNVTVLEPVKDVRKELLQSSIYVMPSRREGFGMVLIEAMECGLACISFDCPTGPRNIISHGIDGILVPPGKTDGLAGEMERIIGVPAELKKLANGGIKSAKKYYPKNILAQWTSFLTTETGLRS